MTTDIKAERGDLLTNTSTAELIKNLRELDHLTKTNPTPEHRCARAWVQEELERRFPVASSVVGRTYELADPTVQLDQVQILLWAIKEFRA